MRGYNPEYLGMYITIIYTILCMGIGAWVASVKKDFATRGAAVSMFAGMFGPILMGLDVESRARTEKKEVWPTRGPEAVILNLVFLIIFNYYV